MAVLRIVATIAATDLAAADAFYGSGLGLERVMDHGWVVTFGGTGLAPVQVSVAREGGSGAPVPDLSVEVDDFEATLARLGAAGFPVLYGPADEPWGVRRAFLRDPFGRLVNVLTHRP